MMINKKLNYSEDEMEIEELEEIKRSMKEENVVRLFKVATVGYVINSIVFLLSIALVSYLVIKFSIWFSLLYILVLIVFKGD